MGSKSTYERQSFEMLLFELASALLRAPPADADQIIARSCQALQRFFALDRFGLLQLQREGGTLELILSCYNEGVTPIPERVHLASGYPWITRAIFSGKPLGLNTVALPSEADRDRESLLESGVHSFFVIPLLAGRNEEYVLVGSSVRRERVWPEGLLHRIKLVGEMIVSTLRRKQLDVEFSQRVGECSLAERLVGDQKAASRRKRESRNAHADIVGHGQGIWKVLDQIEQVAPTNTTVLILGETGTGKELVARAVHRMSQRSGKPLVMVNCAALPPSLIESELFGREKGAYTGALTSMVGRFELANGGTLFLDEIGELPREMQSKLLRVLESGCLERLGSSRTQRVNVRILAATNQDIAIGVTQGAFRSDLYYRLSVFPIHLPLLRDRPEDIPLLVWHFVKGFESSMGKRIEGISPGSFDRLKEYDWPGNVRELRNVVERAMITSHGAILNISAPGVKAGSSVRSVSRSQDDLGRETLLRALEGSGWRISGPGGAAAALGMKRTTLHSRMKRLGIRRPSTH